MPINEIRNVLDLDYKPESFCKEYVDIRKSSRQLTQFMATVLGLKKSYDDWFSMDLIEGIKELCKKYDLEYKFDWVFVPKQDVSKVISGGKRLPTTKCLGLPFEEKLRDTADASVHVFFSRSRKNLELCFRNGWYPLIIRNRAIHKPYIDYLRFGYFLGYPDCCVDFFRRYNNHFQYNYLFEALKNTKTKPRTYCNPLLKDHTFSYVYHMPCSYDCGETLRYVNKLRDRLIRLEPKLVELTDRLLAKPFLALGEQNSYIFEGEMDGNEIFYSDFAFAGVNQPQARRFDPALKQGNRIKVDSGRINIYKDKEKILDRRKPLGAFVIKFRD
jgi:hypothetical protein